MFGCFHWLTGGCVNEIINQEAGWCTSNNGEDKVEKFCETYKDFIDVSDAHQTFLRNWESEKNSGSASLFRALRKSFTGDFMKACVAKLVWSLLLIFSIWFFVFEILDFIKKKDKGQPHHTLNYEFYLCAGFFAAMFVLSIGIQQMGIYSTILGSKVKAALTTEIYKKMIVRDAYGSKADVVALVAKDVEKIAEACLSLQFLWSGIFETVTVFVVTLTLLGNTILPGVGLIAVFMPLQYLMGMVVAYRKKDLAVVSDERISLMEEIMRSIKLIKIY